MQQLHQSVMSERDINFLWQIITDDKTRCSYTTPNVYDSCLCGSHHITESYQVLAGSLIKRGDVASLFFDSPSILYHEFISEGTSFNKETFLLAYGEKYSRSIPKWGQPNIGCFCMKSTHTGHYLCSCTLLRTVPWPFLTHHTLPVSCCTIFISFCRQWTSWRRIQWMFKWLQGLCYRRSPKMFKTTV